MLTLTQDNKNETLHLILIKSGNNNAIDGGKMTKTFIKMSVGLCDFAVDLIFSALSFCTQSGTSIDIGKDYKIYKTLQTV